MLLKIKKLVPEAQLPAYAHPTDAGMDLTSVEDVVIKPWSQALVSTGIAIELPTGTEAQIRPRSGLALKHGISITNTPGTIDESYRGEIKVILINLSANAFTVEKGMRIAQMVIAPVIHPDVIEATELSDTVRGAGGFGSTSV